MTSYETEKTGLLFLICTDNTEHRITIPLPKRVKLAVNQTQPFAEVTIYDYKLDPLPKNVAVFSLSFNNSPYSRHEAFLVDLGYYSLVIRFAGGLLKQDGNNLVYVTNKFNYSIVKGTVPQRRVTSIEKFEKTLPDAQPFFGFVNTLEIVDFLFNETLENRINMVRTHFNYKEDIGRCHVANFSLKSYHEPVGVLKETNFIGIHNCLKWQENTIKELMK